MNISYRDLRFGIRRLGIPLTLRCYRDRCVIVAHQAHRFATVSKGISYSVLQIRKRVHVEAHMRPLTLRMKRMGMRLAPSWDAIWA